MPREPDPYAVLDLESTATDEDVRAAYLKLAAKYHPDQHQGNPLSELASERMAEINHAYELLSDPLRRAAYDAGAHTQANRVAADRANRGRFIRGAALLLAVPLLFRFAALILRALGAGGRLVMEATAALPGGRWATLAGLCAMVVLLVALFRRPKR